MKNDKFAHTVLYLLQRCSGEKPGLTKLVKLLYYVDSTHYKTHLRSVSGASYVALERGPVPDGYAEILDELERRGFVAKQDVRIAGHDKPKAEYLPLADADLDTFTVDELATLDHVLLQHGTRSGKDLSDLTHEDGLQWSWVWDPRSPGKPIPDVLWRWFDNFSNHRVVSRGIARAKDPRILEQLSQLSQPAE